MNPFIPILFFGFVYFGIRLLEIYFPPFAAELLQKFGNWWDFHTREKKESKLRPNQNYPIRGDVRRWGEFAPDR